MVEDDMTRAAEYFKPHEYEVICEAGAGINLPAEKDYRLKISFGNFVWISDKPANREGNYVRWTKRSE